MKTLRHLLKRFVCWANYPTSRERLWNMFALGKQAGIKEALKDLPIVKVQPRQTAKPVVMHLPPGEWSRQWRQMTGALAPIAVKEMSPEQIAQVPTIRDLRSGLDKEATLEVPAVVALLHQKRYATRKLG
jgi:hypothetical protein